MDKYFKNRFENVIKGLGKNVRQVSEALDMSHTGLSNIINGISIPKISVLSSLLELKGDLNLDWLITGRGSMYLSETQTGIANVEEATENYSTAMTNLREEIQYLKELNTTLTKMNKLYEEKINQLEQQLHNGQLPDRKKNVG